MSDQVSELTTIFRYLDVLRESGATNMYGAGSYLMRDLDLPRKEAVRVLSLWIKTFDSCASPEDRANKAATIPASQRGA